MHELSLAHSILRIAEQSIPPGKNLRVTGVTLEVGELSGIETESLDFAYSVIKKDTLLSDSTLDIRMITGEAHCKTCNCQYPMHSFGTPCPSCYSYEVNITRGREMKVINIVVSE